MKFFVCSGIVIGIILSNIIWIFLNYILKNNMPKDKLSEMIDEVFEQLETRKFLEDEKVLRHFAKKLVEELVPGKSLYNGYGGEVWNECRQSILDKAKEIGIK